MEDVAYGIARGVMAREKECPHLASSEALEYSIEGTKRLSLCRFISVSLQRKIDYRLITILLRPFDVPATALEADVQLMGDVSFHFAIILSPHNLT